MKIDELLMIRRELLPTIIINGFRDLYEISIAVTVRSLDPSRFG